MRCVEHVQRMGDRRVAYSILVKKIEGKRHLEIVGVDGRIILKYTLKKRGGRMDSIDLAHGGAR